MAFPETRLRRLRTNPVIRDMISETSLSVNDLIMPLFVCHGKKFSDPVASMPGVSRLSVDLILEECRKIIDCGVRSVLLFGIPDHKDEHGLVACDDNGIVQQAIRAIKEEFAENLLIIADVCNCEYTTHGHCGTIVDNDVDNDLTLETLSKQSVSLTRAGADVIAPSDMMDGRVGHIRSALDQNGFSKTLIMSYSAKYASGFYGPFREAAGSEPKSGDRRSYQMDPANSDEAMREIALDMDEGADIIMIKPALSYLDIIYRAKHEFNIPVAAYNVSGEYSMIKAAAANGWIDEERVMMETAISIKRAGADIIITYFAKEIASFLNR